MAARPTAQTAPVAEVMTDKELSKANSDVAVPTTRFDDEQLLAISNFDDALALLGEQGIALESASDTLGNGFAILKDKGNLIGVELMCLSWQFNKGENGAFVSVNVLAKMPGNSSPAKLVLNDGSTGIYAQLKKYTDRSGRTAGMYVKNGLTRSDYTYEDEKTGETKQATTFYLDTSA